MAIAKVKNLISYCLMVLVTLGLPVKILAQTTEVLSAEAQNAMNAQNTAFLGNAGLGTVSLAVMVSLIIKALLSFLGVIFVVLIIYAGFLWMTSAGNDEKIATAKKIMVAAVIGLVIIFSAYAITLFVIYYIVGSQELGTTGGSAYP